MTAPDSAGREQERLRMAMVELNDLAEVQGGYSHARDLFRTLAAELAEARAKLARVEALHRPGTTRIIIQDRGEVVLCANCHWAWPCTTYEAIHGDAAGNLANPSPRADALAALDGEEEQGNAPETR